MPKGTCPSPLVHPHAEGAGRRGVGAGVWLLAAGDSFRKLDVLLQVIVHLIRREGILVELSKPVDKGDGETDEQFRLRVQENRVLALSPNYDPSN